MDHKFYEETLHYWSELQEVKVPTAEIIFNQTISDNRYITIQNKPTWVILLFIRMFDY